MAELYSEQYNNAYVLEPSQKVPAGQLTGRVKTLVATHTFAADVNAISDVVKLFKLPAGARIVDCKAYCPSLGTTGILTIGWLGSQGLGAADADGLIASLDAGGQAALASLAVASGLKKASAETVIQAVFTEASDNAEGVELVCVLSYVLD